jgi:phosphomethylpyrimidine synthase
MNIPTLQGDVNINIELEKLRTAIEYKSDAVMDLSTGGDLSAIRQAIIASSPLPLGTVPIYQAGIEAIEKRGAIVNMTADDIFNLFLEFIVRV